MFEANFFIPVLTVLIERLAENDEQIRLVEFVESFMLLFPAFRNSLQGSYLNSKKILTYSLSNFGGAYFYEKYKFSKGVN